MTNKIFKLAAAGFATVLIVCVVIAITIFFSGESYQDHEQLAEGDLSEQVRIRKMDAVKSDLPPEQIALSSNINELLVAELGDRIGSLKETALNLDLLRKWLSQLSDEELKALEPSMAGWMEKRLRMLQSAKLSESDQLVSRNVGALFDAFVHEYGSRKGAETLAFISKLPLEVGAVPYMQSAIRAWHSADQSALESYIFDSAQSSLAKPEVFRKTLQYYFEVVSEEGELDVDTLASTDGVPLPVIETALATAVLDDQEGEQILSMADAALKHQNTISDRNIYQTIAARLSGQDTTTLEGWVSQIENSEVARAAATGLIEGASKMPPSKALALMSGASIEHIASIGAGNQAEAQATHADYLNQYVSATLTRSGRDKGVPLEIYRQLETIDPGVAQPAMRTIENTLRLRYGAEEAEKILSSR